MLLPPPNEPPPPPPNEPELRFIVPVEKLERLFEEDVLLLSYVDVADWLLDTPEGPLLLTAACDEDWLLLYDVPGFCPAVLVGAGLR